MPFSRLTPLFALFALACQLTSSLCAQVPLSEAAPTPPTSNEIHVDDHCRVLSQLRPTALDTGTRPAFRADAGICKRENLHSSQVVETVESGVLTRTRVSAYQATFVLTNPTAKSIIFVVDKSVPRGWKIDPQPEPDELTETSAIYRVRARPGQTVSVHVGLHD